MEYTEKDREEIINDIKNWVDNYPDIEKMVSEGMLVYHFGWYEPKDQETYFLISKYIKAIRVNKNGKTQVKICKISKKLERMVQGR
ncbi:hypothetical protein ACI49Z_002625 [Cronobacter turicensis]|uniref:hypothetical protein n=1 Tax=Cronobacter turicensis TaxID=413502 RepID=UPI0013760AF5|nr:hypothetical protein [Cronobacter turicensis]EGT5683436.1 hypothetical protein [Cronobacter turicensis]EGT5742221.1 hypothetical protein [Cronobacter turicensis]ELY6321850.1 hypothetical protein [Cronobacter turicensis]ELY7491224.1 hypothetical protein [Cronobacter turicensis]MDI6433446.1 hypothetical protein [Cronobacter turicensis]